MKYRNKRKFIGVRAKTHILREQSFYSDMEPLRAIVKLDLTGYAGQKHIEKVQEQNAN